jgi:hypothetical protein
LAAARLRRAFYRVFNRFARKCFLHEALMFWGCAAKQRLSDNTNLARRRGIAASLIEPLVPAGKLYADRRGNAVFPLVAGKSQQPVGAELRGTGPRVWRGMAPSTRKDAGYFWIGDPGSREIVVCESAINAMSRYQMEPHRIGISTSGVRADPPWLTPLLARGYAILCGFDADDPGDAAAARMLAIHPTVRRLRPPARDWNDVLVASHQRLPAAILTQGHRLPASRPAVNRWGSLSEQKYGTLSDRQRSKHLFHLATPEPLRPTAVIRPSHCRGSPSGCRSVDITEGVYEIEDGRVGREVLPPGAAFLGNVEPLRLVRKRVRSPRPKAGLALTDFDRRSMVPDPVPGESARGG